MANIFLQIARQLATNWDIADIYASFISEVIAI
jgi:hypothetical protein